MNEGEKGALVFFFKDGQDLNWVSGFYFILIEYATSYVYL